MKSQDKFNCFLPITFEKSKDENGVVNYKFHSVASNDEEDSSGDSGK